MTTFLLIRHADTDAIGKTISGWMPGIHLNRSGRCQAVVLAEYLSEKPIAQLYSSPLERARETAQPIAKSLGLTLKIADEIGEVHFGDWTNQSLEALATLPGWQRWNQYRSGTRLPKGELLLEVQTRIVTWLERLHGEFPDQTIACVSHAEVIKSALAFYLGMPLDLLPRLEIDPASCSRLVLGDHAPTLLGLNEKPPGAQRREADQGKR